MGLSAGCGATICAPWLAGQDIILQMGMSRINKRMQSYLKLQISVVWCLESDEAPLRFQPKTKTITIGLECCMATKAMHFIVAINSHI
jgi:hypothetical protein